MKLSTGCVKDKIFRKMGRSAWQKGVSQYAMEMLGSLEDSYVKGSCIRKDEVERFLMDGARTWKQYSEGGFGLVEDAGIAARLCTMSEWKRYKAGKLERPNSLETWMDVQARALMQACMRIHEELEGCNYLLVSRDAVIDSSDVPHEGERVVRYGEWLED